MGCSIDLRNDSRPAREPYGHRDRFSTIPAVVDEVAWRALPSVCVTPPSEARIVAARWRSLEASTAEAEAETPADFHVMGIALRSMNVRIASAGKTVLDGVVAAGTFNVTPPSVPAHGIFRGAYDVIHLFVPNTLIAECDDNMLGHRARISYTGIEPGRDAIVEWLGRALLEANNVDSYSERMYVDSLSMAIVARLWSLARRTVADARPDVRALPRWRLRRAIDYVESRLAEPISLAEVASATGLTRMHFAAGFRAATGLRPHEYLLRRRIERSQEMLMTTDMTLVNVARAVGFQTQSHYSNVFRRFVGQPPRAWLQSQCGEKSTCP
jgi:AraC family transcriptional regulator